MIEVFGIWLFKVSLAMLALAVLYHLAFRGLSFFNWNRIYLVGGVVVCLLLPLLPVNNAFSWVLGGDTVVSGTVFTKLNVKWDQLKTNEKILAAAQGTFDRTAMLMNFVTLLYLAGAFVKCKQLVKTLYGLYRLMQESVRGGTEKVFVQTRFPTFSFFNYIFLHQNAATLSVIEREQILLHEQTHGRQWHSLDILFLEVVGIVFWFNPCVGYLAKSVKEVHEYIVDQYVTRRLYSYSQYGQLLMKLATTPASASLRNTFSESAIFQRINMLVKPKSSPMKKLRFLWSIPVMSVIVLLCSCIKTPKVELGEFSARSGTGETFTATGLKIGKISWEGNAKYTDEDLTNMLGVKTGDACDTTRIFAALYGGVKANGTDLIGLYMDKGYLFFRVEPRTKLHGNIVDISFEVYEGSLAKIGKVIFVGNKKIASQELLDKIETKSGELFSRTKLIHSQRILSEMGKFDPKNIQIDPTPDWQSVDKQGVMNVDLKFVVSEI